MNNLNLHNIVYFEDHKSDRTSIAFSTQIANIPNPLYFIHFRTPIKSIYFWKRIFYLLFLNEFFRQYFKIQSIINMCALFLFYEIECETFIFLFYISTIYQTIKTLKRFTTQIFIWLINFLDRKKNFKKNSWNICG